MKKIIILTFLFSLFLSFAISLSGQLYFNPHSSHNQAYPIGENNISINFIPHFSAGDAGWNDGNWENVVRKGNSYMFFTNRLNVTIGTHKNLHAYIDTEFLFDRDKDIVDVVSTRFGNGDTKVGLKYLFFDKVPLSVELFAIFPTGYKLSSDEYLYRSFSQDKVSMGQKLYFTLPKDKFNVYGSMGVHTLNGESSFMYNAGLSFNLMAGYDFFIDIDGINNEENYSNLNASLSKYFDDFELELGSRFALGEVNQFYPEWQSFLRLSYNIDLAATDVDDKDLQKRKHISIDEPVRVALVLFDEDRKYFVAKSLKLDLINRLKNLENIIIIDDQNINNSLFNNFLPEQVYLDDETAFIAGEELAADILVTGYVKKHDLYRSNGFNIPILFSNPKTIAETVVQLKVFNLKKMKRYYKEIKGEQVLYEGFEIFPDDLDYKKVNTLDGELMLEDSIGEVNTQIINLIKFSLISNNTK